MIDVLDVEQEQEQEKSAANFSGEPINHEIILFRQGKSNLDKLANVVMPLITKMAKSEARKVGVESDDLVQEMWTTFERVVLVKFETDRQIEPFLRRCTQKIALSLLNPNKSKEVNLDDDGHAAVEAASSLNDEQYHTDFEGDADRQTAIDKINTLMHNSSGSFTSKGNTNMQQPSASKNPLDFKLTTTAMGGLAGGEVEVESPKDPVVKHQAKRVKKELTTLQKEIVDARTSLSMTQQEFATSIDIDLFRLSSYEYGRANPPEMVMDKVRILIKGGNPRLNQVKVLKKTYEQPMSQILSRWCQEYKLDYTNDNQLAMAMDTTPATIHRWKKDDVKPSVDEIEKYRQAFEKGAKKMFYAVNNFIVDPASGILARR